MRILILGLALSAALAGCTTMTPQERRAADETECRTYGFRKGTEAFAECLQRLDLDRRAESRSRRAELDNWMNRPPSVVYVPVPQRPTPGPR